MSNNNTPNTETNSVIVVAGANNIDGVQVGAATTSKVGFYGKTPAVQQAVGSVVATTVAVSTTSAIWGFSTSTQANAIITAVAAIQSALKTLGISS